MTQAHELFGHTMALNKAGAATPNGASTYNIANTTDFAIADKAYQKATVSGGTTPTANPSSVTFSTLAASQGCVIVWALNAAGTVGLFQGEIETLDSSNAFNIRSQFPDIDFDTWCPYAYTVLANGSTGSTFTIGSSNWNATGMTATTVDVITLPRRPQES